MANLVNRLAKFRFSRKISVSLRPSFNSNSKDMKKYNLGFISDEDIYNHVKATVLQYRRNIDLKEFNKNIIDPIKLTFDAKIYGQTMQQTIESECIRQIDKTNNNRIGYFHQYLFKFAGNGWVVPDNGDQGGFDVLNDERHIYAILRNKPSKMKHQAKRTSMIRMFDKILKDKDAVCYLVDMSECSSKDYPWKLNIDSNTYENANIRYVSIKSFYDIAFEKSDTYEMVCNVLPNILSDVFDVWKSGMIS